jgi:hypothetical protein
LAKKSRSTINCPIFAQLLDLAITARLGVLTRPASNARAAWSKSCFFQA